MQLLTETRAGRRHGAKDSQFSQATDQVKRKQ
jgi:hypothetical protein